MPLRPLTRFIDALDHPAPRLLHRAPSGAQTPLAVEPGSAFEGPPMGRYQVAEFRFAACPEQGRVLTKSRPLAIGTLYE